MMPCKTFFPAPPHPRVPLPVRAAALFVVLGWLNASCAHVVGKKATTEDVKHFATVEDFIDDNFVIGVQAFSDLMPTGKPDWVIDKGFVRYRVPLCQGELSYVQKPSADLATFCAAKGGGFSTRTVADWGPQDLVTRGYVGTYACWRGDAVQWQACVRVESVEPAGSCWNVTFLIKGSSTAQTSAPICDAVAR